MYETNYHKADSVDGAVSAMGTAEDGKYLAGGMTLIPTMKQRLAAPSDRLPPRAIWLISVEYPILPVYLSTAALCVLALPRPMRMWHPAAISPQPVGHWPILLPTLAIPMCAIVAP